MYKSYSDQRHIINFKRWTRRKEAILVSLSNIVKIGVLSFSLSIVIKPANTFSQSADTIRNGSNIDLEEVEVIGEGAPEVFSQLARTITIISSEEISSSSATSIQDLLDYVSGIDIRQRNSNGVQADIQLRGGTFDQVLVLLNGINITDPQTGHFNLNIPVDLSSIERIEILHGSGARIYGANAYKGVINIITYKEYSGVNAGISFGEFGLNHSDLNLGIALDNTYHNLGISRDFSDGYSHNTDYTIKNLFYTGGLKLKAADIDWQAGLNDKAFGANDFYSPVFPDQYEETSTNFGSIEISSKGKLKFTGSTYFRRHNDHFLLKRDDPSFYENYHRTDIGGLKLYTQIKSNAGTTFLGIESRYEKILSTVLGNEVEDGIEIKRSDNRLYSRQFSRNNAGFFAEHKMNIKNFYVSGGFLLNINPEYKIPLALFPGFDVSYRLMDQRIKVHYSISRSLRLPTFTDMFYRDPGNMGNSLLQPEELFSLEGGMEYEEGKLSSGLNYFMDYGKNVIDWVMFPESSVYEAKNILKLNSRGFEINGGYSHSGGSSHTKITKLFVSYAFIDQTLNTGDYVSKYAGDFLRHKFISAIDIRIYNSITINYTIRYQSRKGSYSDYDESTTTRLISAFKPYWLSDLKLAFSRKHYKIFVNANNLFDAQYNDVGNLVQPGRWISGGIELRFPGL